MAQAGRTEPVRDVALAEMTHADLDQVLEVERLSYRTPWTRAAFQRELSDNAFACYIAARWDGKVVGYAGMWVVLDEAHVTNVAVHPAFRRRGIASRLLRELMRRAWAAGARRMTLEVRKSNLGAQTLYRSFGFEPRGIRKMYYSDTREDAIVMWKDDLAADLSAREEGDGAVGGSPPGGGA